MSLQSRKVLDEGHPPEKRCWENGEPAVVSKKNADDYRHDRHRGCPRNYQWPRSGRSRPACVACGIRGGRARTRRGGGPRPRGWYAPRHHLAGWRRRARPAKVHRACLDHQRDSRKYLAFPVGHGSRSAVLRGGRRGGLSARRRGGFVLVPRRGTIAPSLCARGGVVGAVASRTGAVGAITRTRPQPPGVREATVGGKGGRWARSGVSTRPGKPGRTWRWAIPLLIAEGGKPPADFGWSLTQHRLLGTGANPEAGRRQ